VVLGRAFRASGDRRYAEAVVEQLESWLEQCPFGYGMNWRSPLELGIRLINWVWALDLIRESRLVGAALHERVLHSVYLHAWEIARKLSRGSSGNNHLTGELAGLYVAAAYFTQLANAESWRRLAVSRLESQIRELTAADGGWGEHAIGYQLFVLQFFLACGLAARAIGEDFSRGYWERVERMLEFVAALAEGGPLPAFGDADDGYVLNLGGDRQDSLGLLSTGAVLFENSRLKAQSGGFREMTRWLLGRTARERYDRVPPQARALSSRAFRESGYYLLQSGHPQSADRISVFVDCAELGFGAIAAHGHADALSITLRAFGRDILVDPGTYDYFTYREWRSYFRSTRAHNTVVVDGRDQSEMLGPFLWGTRANSRVIAWEAGPSGATFTGEQDGYARLSSPVSHRRTVRLEAPARVTIRDEIGSTGTHIVELMFHSAPDVSVERVGNRIALTVPEGVVRLEIDPACSVSLHRAQEHPIAGWVSPRYHVRVPATTIAARCEISGPAVLVSALQIDAAAE
jgi:hypothetical protein